MTCRRLVTIFYSNKSAIAIAYNPQFHSKMKYIKIKNKLPRDHFIEKVKVKENQAKIIARENINLQIQTKAFQRVNLIHNNPI